MDTQAHPASCDAVGNVENYDLSIGTVEDLHRAIRSFRGTAPDALALVSAAQRNLWPDDAPAVRLNLFAEHNADVDAAVMDVLVQTEGKPGSQRIIAQTIKPRFDRSVGERQVWFSIQRLVRAGRIRVIAKIDAKMRRLHHEYVIMAA